MTKQNFRRHGTKKVFLISLLSLIMCVTMLAGTTLALLTDSVTGEQNIITAGNLDIGLQYKNADHTTYNDVKASTNIFKENALWEPGHVEYAVLKISNLGTLTLKYTLGVNVAEETQDAVNMNGECFRLSDHLKYSVIDGDQSGKTDNELITAAGEGTVLNSAYTSNGNMVAGDADKIVTLIVWMPATVGNTVNYKTGTTAPSIRLVIDLNAGQDTEESEDQDDENEDDPSALWFNPDASGATPSEVTSIAFTKTAPEASAYDSTWTSPANSTAYYDSANKALTYVPNGDNFRMTDNNLLRICNRYAVKGLGVDVLGTEFTDEYIIAWINEAVGEEVCSTIEDAIAFCEAEDEDNNTREAVVTLIQDNICSEQQDEGYCFGKVTSVTGLELWDVSSVTNFSYMFYESKLAKIDVSGWDTSSAVNMQGMFEQCNYATEIKFGTKWNTSKVTDMSHMFLHCHNITSIDVSGFDTGNVTDMGGMFTQCEKLTSLDISNFNTAKVTDMGSLFNYCCALTSLNISGLDTSNVTDMGYMFKCCSAMESLDISAFNTAKVTDMTSMFSGCTTLKSLNVQGLDTSNVTDMYYMFYNLPALTSLDLTSWDTGKVTDMRYMFALSENLAHIYVGDSWSVAATVSSEGMFYQCSDLPNYTAASTDKTCAHVGTVSEIAGYLETKPVA